MSLLDETSTVYTEAAVSCMDPELMKSKLSSFSDYDFDTKSRQRLPIDKMEGEILSLLRKEPAVVIKGFTG